MVRTARPKVSVEDKMKEDVTIGLDLIVDNENQSACTITHEQEDNSIPTINESTYTIGDPKDPSTTSFSLISQDGTLFGSGKQSLISISQDQSINIELNQGLLNKFLLLKWLRPKSFADITGLILNPKIPEFNISFIYDQTNIIEEADLEGVKYPTRYEIQNCSIESIELLHIAGPHIAFTKAIIRAQAIKVRMDEIQPIINTSYTPTSYERTEFI